MLPTTQAGTLGFYDRRTDSVTPYISWTGDNWYNSRASKFISPGADVAGYLGPRGDYTAVGLPGSANAGYLFDWGSQSWVFLPNDRRTQRPLESEAAYVQQAASRGYAIDAGQRAALVEATAGASVVTPEASADAGAVSLVQLLLGMDADKVARDALTERDANHRDNFNQLTFTVGGAKGPELEALRDEAVELVRRTSEKWVAAHQTAALVAAVESGDQTGLLLAMLG